MLLSDLKVVEWSTWIAGPGCAAVMADWGAQVIKVEVLGGRRDARLLARHRGEPRQSDLLQREPRQARDRPGRGQA